MHTKPSPWWSRLFYLLTIAVAAGATVGVMALWQNIAQRKAEGEHPFFNVVTLTEEITDPAEWGKNFPRQYDGYLRTAHDCERTRYGGSEAFQKLDDDPLWRTIFKGYPFSIDYREERGHAYMLSDQDMTERMKFKQPGACLHCHSSVLPAYQVKGREAGVPDEKREEQIMKGFEVVCGMDYPSARKLVTHPVTCNDCHEPKSMQLRVTRPGLLNALDALAKSGKDIAPLPSLTRHRVENEARKKESRPIKSYNPNTQASRQEMRSLVCAQCHVEYYFKKEGKLVTFPWHNGLKMEEIEEYYDQTVKHVDWKHPDSGAEVLKAQHPEFELWSQGIHARSGVSCADCHMPYKREGAVKISDHHVRSPLLNIAGACQTCHRSSEKEILERAEASQERTKKLMTSAEYAVVDLINEIKSAEGGDAEMLENARKKQRQAQWRLDFVAAENSMGFHAPQESARILAEALDLARQGQLQAYKAKPGAQKR